MAGSLMVGLLSVGLTRLAAKLLMPLNERLIRIIDPLTGRLIRITKKAAKKE
jgi:undecaprenyl-diphosphatase